MERTIAAIATPPGKGGLCVVRISGEGAHSVAAAVFKPLNNKKSLEQAPGYTALFGHAYYGGKLLDECIALSFKAPKSYTGEDTVELSCHGGEVVAKQLLSALVAAGAHPAGPGEFTKRAFLNGKISLTQAEAVKDLINATTAMGAAAAAATLEGALHKAIEKECIAPLNEVLAHIAAYTDFPEEGVEPLAKEKLAATLAGVEGALKKRIEDYEKGAVLRRGVNTAIVGSPNVGKSTLLNLLAGYDKAIVTPVPGTTRDVVEEAVNLAGTALIVADTAGLRTTEDEVEKEGIRRSYARLERAGLVLAVFDQNRDITPEDVALAEACKGKAAIAVLNKADLAPKFNFEEIKSCFATAVTLSAKKPQARQKLEDAVEAVLGIKTIDTDGGLLAGERQLFAATEAAAAVKEAINAFESGFSLDVIGVCLDDALAALYSLTGQNLSEEVVDTLFETFCVGK